MNGLDVVRRTVFSEIEGWLPPTSGPSQPLTMDFEARESYQLSTFARSSHLTSNTLTLTLTPSTTDTIQHRRRASTTPGTHTSLPQRPSTQPSTRICTHIYTPDPRSPIPNPTTQHNTTQSSRFNSLLLHPTDVRYCLKLSQT